MFVVIWKQNKPKTDTSAVEARNGKDIQGIPWEKLNFTRDKYREARLRQYQNYENLSGSREDIEKVSFCIVLLLNLKRFLPLYSKFDMEHDRKSVC